MRRVASGLKVFAAQTLADSGPISTALSPIILW